MKYEKKLRLAEAVKNTIQTAHDPSTP